MKNLVSALLIFGLAMPFCMSSAQTSRKTSPTENRAVFKAKQQYELNGKLPSTREARTTGNDETINEKPGENERMFAVNGYKLQFPANQDMREQQALAVVYLYGKPDQLLGTARFYGSNSNHLFRKVFMDKSEVVQLAYSIEQLPHILAFLDQASKLVLVFDEKERSAYLSSGVIPMGK